MPCFVDRAEWQVLTGRDFEPYWAWCEEVAKEVSDAMKACSPTEEFFDPSRVGVMFFWAWNVLSLTL